MCDTDEPSPQSQYDITQEREFYKYFQPIDLGLSTALQNTSSDKKHVPTPALPRASPDRALTAFAQLATLRLNCRRAFISFFDRQYQYIVAEATKTLSLEDDSAFGVGDELKYGVSIHPRQGSVCEHTVAVPIHLDSLDKDVSVFVTPDCTKDDRFKHQHYTKHSSFRFYAGVAIVSPDGYRIGSYCVVDDKPRKGISDEERAFMKDMATTVMVHMEMLRAKSETVKGERLVRGLGSFVEGKASIDDWWMDGHPIPPQATNRLQPNATNSTIHQWASKQYSMHHNPVSQKPNHFDERADEQEAQQDTGMLLHVESHHHDQSSEHAEEEAVKPLSQNPTTRETEKQDTLSVEIKATFGRACLIIREALGVDGVCCFDAKAGQTFGGLIDQKDNERPTHRNSFQDQVADVDEDGKDEDDKPCEILGFSTPDLNSIHGDLAEKVTDGMTEKFLRSLLRRFPHGKILNFDENGKSPSEYDAPSGPPPDWPASNTVSKRNQKLRSGEAAFLRQIFPSVRSLAIVPLWDSRQQFFSGCVAWTRSGYRVLSTHSELSYLAAFGDSIMAEVSRVDTKIADKAKSDFISSISHELRSPLHGILGSVECLQDSELDTFQEHLVHTVETCGKTLLDTIDHLLDFAKINNFTRKGKSKSGGAAKNIGLDVDVDLGVVTEEVLETVFAGHDFMRATSANVDNEVSVTSTSTSVAQQAESVRRKSSGAAALMHPGSGKKAVSVVVDIDKAEKSHWIFRTQAGAWRRILMNLFGNSLKYTKQGFVQVKLGADPLPQEGKIAKSTVSLTVIDSGKGIAQDYLNKSLFVPFAQEDSLQPGTGLGLAITAAIIHSMGGEIEVKSEQGCGTEIKVTLEMLHAPYSQVSLEQSIISSASRRTKGLKIGFVGFDADSFKDQPEPILRSPDNASYYFMSSFHTLCSSWFGMEMKIMQDLDRSDAKIFLTTEQGLGQIRDQLEKHMQKQSDKDVQDVLAATPLLVLCQSAATANAMLHNQRAGGDSADIAEYISQPCGPRKLAKSLILCLDRLEASRNPNKPAPSFGQPSDRISEADGSDDLPKRRNRESDSKEKTSQLTIQTPGRRGSLPLKRPQVVSRDSVDRGSGNAGATKAASTGAGHTSPTSQRSLPERKSSNKNMTKAKISRNVLLVDDNNINLQLLVTYMMKSGHNFTTASNGREALDAYTSKCEQINASGGPNEDSSAGATKGKDGAAAAVSRTGQRPPPFDFILMDLTMPVMDGLESTRHIRAYERSNNIKGATVIALTGLGSVNAQQEAYSSGVNTFVTKPVKLKELSHLFDKDDDDYSKEGDKKGEGQAEKKNKDAEKDHANGGIKKDTKKDRI